MMTLYIDRTLNATLMTQHLHEQMCDMAEKTYRHRLAFANRVVARRGADHPVAVKLLAEAEELLGVWRNLEAQLDAFMASTLDEEDEDDGPDNLRDRVDG